MKINFCCPTRSKPDILKDFLLETVRNCRLPDTQVVVGIDADEEPLYERFFPHPRLIKSVAPREDSLGAKFNRCAAALDADVYIMGVDDLGVRLVGWDYTVAELAKLFDTSHEDGRERPYAGIGMVTFGQQWNEPGLAAFQCVTKRFVELNGFFMAPYFPYWWHDTWNLELGELTGRMIHFPADIRYPDRRRRGRAGTWCSGRTSRPHPIAALRGRRPHPAGVRRGAVAALGSARAPAGGHGVRQGAQREAARPALCR